MRPNKQMYYLNIAKIVASRGTCIRRNYGAVIVRDDQIISTGYTGAPRGSENCTDLRYCRREELEIPSGERYELCRSVHAEMNAVVNASRSDMIKATMYLVGIDVKTGNEIPNPEPCSLCKRVIVNSGIGYVVTRTTTKCSMAYVDTWTRLI